MNFWDTYDARPLEVRPGYEGMARQAPVQTPDAIDVERSALNDTTGVCTGCGIASDDVLLGTCADCVRE